MRLSVPPKRLLIALLLTAVTGCGTPPVGTPTSAVAGHCQSEQLAVHYHAHLDILAGAKPLRVPAGVGIELTCVHWLHTHDASGIIHVEAPVDQSSATFTLGDFFAIWRKPLDSSHVASLALPEGQHVMVYLDGQVWSGDPRSVPVTPYEEIVLAAGDTSLPIPTRYAFPEGF